VPAVEADGPIDPTGAGDTFAATYLSGRAAGAEPVEAARMAAEAVSAFFIRT
jgi:sugar/nucleoside kinase (ribokinase family)